MKSSLTTYSKWFLMFLSISIGFGQNIEFENEEALNKYFSDSIILNYRQEVDKTIDNPESVFLKYYKGLDLIDIVNDSLKFKFYDEYAEIMASSKLIDLSNRLAKKGIQLSQEGRVMPSGVELGFYYNRLAFNFLELQKYDSVTWAYKENIERNRIEGSDWQNVSAYNNLGYHYYLNLKDNDSALYYLNKTNGYPQRDLAFRNSLTLSSSIKDNIALVYLDQERYREAGLLFKEIYEYYGESRRGYLWRERWLRAGLQYVDVELKLGNFRKAEKILKGVENNFSAIQNFDEAPVEYFPSKLLLLQTKQKYSRAIGDFRKSDLYGEAYLKLKDSLGLRKNNKLRDDLNLIREIGLYNARDAIQKEKTFSIIEKENLALDLKRKSTKTYWFISILALLFIMLGGYFYFRKMRRYNEYQSKMQVEYSQNLIKTQEEERKRVARELHDSVGQKLMLLSKTSKKLESEETANLVSSTLEEVRDISRGLHPSNLERLGVTMAISALVYDINANTDLFFTDEIENIDRLLPKGFELHLYRIIQETLTNIVKHAEAKAVVVKVQKRKETVEVFIKDNGKGFNLESSKEKLGLGMKTIIERSKIMNADMKLNSGIEQGTYINLSIPHSK